MHNTFHLLSLLCLSLSIKGLAADAVTLSNDEILKGEIISIDGEQTLKLKHPSCSELIELDALKIKQLTLSTKPQSESTKPKKINSVIHLANGDFITGDIISLTDTTVGIQSDTLGAHHIPRESVSHINFGDAITQKFYDFDQTRKPFLQNKGWKYALDKKSTPILKAEKTATMWEKFDCPQDYIVKFTFGWQREQNPYLRLYLNAKTTSTSSSNDRYEVQIQQHSIVIYSVSNGRKKTIAQHNPREVISDRILEAEIEVRVSRSRKRLTVFLNGKKLVTAKDANALTHSGSHIGIHNYISNSPATLKHINLTNWDGITMKSANELRKKSDKDLIEIDNGDVFTGKIESISKKNNEPLSCAFSGSIFPSGSAQIPLKHIRSIFFKWDAPKQTKLKPTDFHRNSKLQLSSITLEKDEITATHAILGELKIKKSHIKTLQLN